MAESLLHLQGNTFECYPSPSPEAGSIGCMACPLCVQGGVWWQGANRFVVGETDSNSSL